ncbi:unnamed protein product [Arabidopsis halleri]
MTRRTYKAARSSGLYRFWAWPCIPKAQFFPQHQQQPLHLNYRPPLPATTTNNYQTQLHHNGKMGKIGNGWQGQHEDAYHSGHGMQHHDMHGKQYQGGHGMQDYNGQGMKQQDRLMAHQVPPRHVYMNPNHDSGYSHAELAGQQKQRAPQTRVGE